MRILGIDPGLGIVGFGIVDCPQGPEGMGQTVNVVDWGVITTSKDKSDGGRLQEIHMDLHDIVDRFRPEVVAVERLFFFKNAKTLIPVSQARGVILLVLEQKQLPVFEYTPMQVKQAMTGYGKSTKQEIQEMVAQLLQLDRLPKPDDASDALAMALCHYYQVARFPKGAFQNVSS